MEAHDMFKRANRVTRLDKALILGFMAGYRDNPRPNAENVLEIKLNESEVSIILTLEARKWVKFNFFLVKFCLFLTLKDELWFL